MNPLLENSKLAGYQHFCLLLSTGDIYGFAGEEPDVTLRGYITKPVIPRRLRLSEKVVQLSVGKAHSLLLCEFGRVYGVGSNQLGNLGVDPIIQHEFPDPVLINTTMLGDDRVTKIEAGIGYQSFILSDSGRVFSMGNNNGRPENEPFHELRQINQSVFENESIVAISAGSLATAFASASGAVFTCGQNRDHSCSFQLGQGVETPDRVWEPSKVSSLWERGVRVSTISVGHHHTLAIDRENGQLYGWGSNDSGQLGLPEYIEYYPTPLEITAKSAELSDYSDAPIRFHRVSSGWQHSLGLDEEGRVYSWGMGQYGQLGRQLTWKHDRDPTPKYVPFEHQVVAVHAGGFHSMFMVDLPSVSEDEEQEPILGAVAATCGLGTHGQLGGGSVVRIEERDCRIQPELIAFDPFKPFAPIRNRTKPDFDADNELEETAAPAVAAVARPQRILPATIAAPPGRRIVHATAFRNAVAAGHGAAAAAAGGRGGGGAGRGGRGEGRGAARPTARREPEVRADDRDSGGGSEDDDEDSSEGSAQESEEGSDEDEENSDDEVTTNGGRRSHHVSEDGTAYSDDDVTTNGGRAGRDEDEDSHDYRGAYGRAGMPAGRRRDYDDGDGDDGDGDDDEDDDADPEDEGFFYVPIDFSDRPIHNPQIPADQQPPRIQQSYDLILERLLVSPEFQQVPSPTDLIYLALAEHHDIVSLQSLTNSLNNEALRDVLGQRLCGIVIVNSTLIATDPATMFQDLATCLHTHYPRFDRFAFDMTSIYSSIEETETDEPPSDFNLGLFCSTMLQTVTHLRYLTIENCGDLCLDFLCEVLLTAQNNSQLTHLTLNGTMFGAEGFQRLADMLKHNATLRELSVPNNPHANDEVAFVFAEALQVNRTLIALKLRVTELGMEGMTELGVTAIVQALQSNPQSMLAKLDISGVDGSPEISAELQQELRVCLVRNANKNNGRYMKYAKMSVDMAHDHDD